jgi:hypothetical protein
MGGIHEHEMNFHVPQSGKFLDQMSKTKLFKNPKRLSKRN